MSDADDMTEQKTENCTCPCHTGQAKHAVACQCMVRPTESAEDIVEDMESGNWSNPRVEPFGPPVEDQPINIWYSNGVRYEDYRRSDGSIETIETVLTKQQCLGCGDVMMEGHQCQKSK